MLLLPVGIAFVLYVWFGSIPVCSTGGTFLFTCCHQAHACISHMCNMCSVGAQADPTKCL